MKMITTVDDAIDILPHFLTHYSSIGVTTFIIGQLYVADPRSLRSRILEASIGYDVIVDDQFTTPDSVIDGSQVTNKLRERYVTDEEWSLLADLDEFHKYSSPLREIIDHMERDGSQYYYGYLHDRLTLDGHFPPRLDVNLDAQFPIAAQVTREILRANYKKIMVIKGSLSTHIGHHELTQRRVNGAGIGIVYHFKWFGHVVDRIRRHREVRKLTKELEQYVDEHDRLLAHLEAHDGKIDLTTNGLNIVQVF